MEFLSICLFPLGRESQFPNPLVDVHLVNFDVDQNISNIEQVLEAVKARLLFSGTWRSDAIARVFAEEEARVRQPVVCYQA